MAQANGLDTISSLMQNTPAIRVFPGNFSVVLQGAPL